MADCPGENAIDEKIPLSTKHSWWSLNCITCASPCRAFVPLSPSLSFSLFCLHRESTTSQHSCKMYTSNIYNRKLYIKKFYTIYLLKHIFIHQDSSCFAKKKKRQGKNVNDCICLCVFFCCAPPSTRRFVPPIQHFAGIARTHTITKNTTQNPSLSELFCPRERWKKVYTLLLLSILPHRVYI